MGVEQIRQIRLRQGEVVEPEWPEGDAFFVPRGFRGTWETIEPSTKIFVGMQPADLPA